MKKFNIGCGGVKPEGWINTDKSYNLFLSGFALTSWIYKESKKSKVTYLNLNSPWGIEDNCADVVYASHILEHLRPESRKLFVEEVSRILKKGGVLRIVVPDLEALCRVYLDKLEKGDKDASSYLLYWMNLHQDHLYPKNRPLYKKIYDFVQDYPKQHQIMLDRFSLEKYFSGPQWEGHEFSRYGSSSYLKDCIHEVECASEDCPSVYFECLKC